MTFNCNILTSIRCFERYWLSGNKKLSLQTEYRFTNFYCDSIVVVSLAATATYCLLKLTSKCTEALSVSVEDWIEVQGKEEESTVDREKLANERKARFTVTRYADAIWSKPLGPAFEAFLQTLISQVCPILYRNFKSWGARAKDVLLLVVINITVDSSLQGHREGGTMTPGPWNLGGPWGGRWARKRPIEISVKTFFFFWDHLILTGRTVRILVKIFFFGEHIIIWTKLRHCLLLFCSSQNRKSVIFELALGPRSALGAPASVITR